MTGVVDDGPDGTTSVRHDPGHQDRVVGRTVRIETADELAGSFVPGVAVGGEVTAAPAVEDRGRPGLPHRRGGQLGDTLRDRVEVRPDQVPTGEVRPAAHHQAGRVRVRGRHLNLGRRGSGSAADGGAHPVHLGLVEDAMVECDKELPLGAVARQRFQPEHVRQERTVDAGGTLVRRGTPHAVVDAHGRRNVTASDAGAATCLRGVNGVHRRPEKEGAGG
jgi:hypothetical protein